MNARINEKHPLLSALIVTPLVAQLVRAVHDGQVTGSIPVEGQG
jgi:hypothetical protein